MKKVVFVFLIIFCFSNTLKSQCIDSSLISPFCICPMIYAPVCACNGMAYSNDCLAQCDGNTFWGPVDPTLSPGMPCSLSACDVSILGDSIPCNLPTILEAVSAGTAPVTSYQWTDQSGAVISNGNLLTVAIPGIYYVSITDSTGCIDSASINIQTMPMTIYSIPNPPWLCFGDSVYLVFDTSYTNVIWNTGDLTNPLTLFPTQDTIFVAEAIDANGCERRGEIEVFVDTCASSTTELNAVFSIYPNPTKGYLNIDNTYNYNYSITLIDITGKSLLYKENNRGSIKLDIPEIISGLYIIRIDSYNQSLYRKIIIE